MPSKIEDDLLYVEGPNKNIFLYDKDVQTLKKLGGVLVEEYPSFQILAFDNWEDLADDLISEKPQVMILELVDSESSQFFDFIRDLKKDTLTKDIPLMVTGTREVLNKHQHDISKFNLHQIPKAVRIPFFKSVVQACLNEASSMNVELITLEQGENLFLQGDSAKNIYITKSGQLEVYHTVDGEDFILGVIKEREVVGEMAFLEKAPRSASVRAKEHCEILCLNLDNLHSYLEAQPFWLSMILSSLVDRLREANKKIITKN